MIITCVFLRMFVVGEDTMDNNKLKRRQQYNGLGITGFLGLTLDCMG